MEETLTGSREAFGLLVVRYSRAVRAACVARVGLREDLDDMVQETFLRAYKGLPRLRDHSRFGAFVHRIAQNIAIDRLRRGGREAVSLEDVNLEPQTATEPRDDREEHLAQVRALVGRLPPALREAVLMFYFERHSHAEIAGMLGITEAAVNQRLHRARVQLREAFGLRAEQGS